MNTGHLQSRIAIETLYDVLLKQPELRLTAIDSRDRTKAQLFLTGRSAKELYILVGDRAANGKFNKKSTRILIEHPVTVHFPGVRPDPDASPYKGWTIKNAAANRRISVRKQHTVYVDTPEALAALIGWYANTDIADSALGTDGYVQESDREIPVTPGQLGSPAYAAGQVAPTIDPSVPVSDPTEQLLDDEIDAANRAGNFEEEVQLRAMKARRGQPKFRASVLSAYGKQCAITGCNVDDALEAAHIVPHSEGTNWDVSNGFALRADIHTLFDLKLLSVTDDYRIHVAKRLAGSEYEKLNGLSIGLPKNSEARPNRAKLAMHYREFLDRNVPIALAAEPSLP